MKVLAPGTGQVGWSVETTCTGAGNGNGGCGAKLRIEHDDLFETHSSARDEVTCYTTFKCVSCGVLTDVKVPYNVSQGLPSQRTWKKNHPEVDVCKAGATRHKKGCDGSCGL